MMTDADRLQAPRPRLPEDARANPVAVEVREHRLSALRVQHTGQRVQDANHLRVQLDCPPRLPRLGVAALSHRPADKAAVTRAAPLFRDQCAACHGPEGKGDQTRGVPNLTDNDWLYGSTRDDIRGQIFNGRGGVMPSWGERLSPETIKALTIYVHVNAAGR